MQYKGFVASFQYVADIGQFVGEISHSQDTISFSASTFKQLEDTMKIAVDNYLNSVNHEKNPLEMRYIASLKSLVN